MDRTGAYELIGFDEARDRLRFDRRIALGSLDLSQFHVAYCPGDLDHAGSIELYEWMWRDKIAGLVVDGDLSIDGNLEDNSFNGSSAFLLVRGDLRARTITLGGAEVVVMGDVAARGPVYNSQGGGRFEIDGSLLASHLVTDGHATAINGATPTRSWALGFVEAGMRHKVRRFSTYREILTPLAAAEFLDRCGRLDGPNIALGLTDAIRAGRAVLRD